MGVGVEGHSIVMGYHLYALRDCPFANEFLQSCHHLLRHRIIYPSQLFCRSTDGEKMGMRRV